MKKNDWALFISVMLYGILFYDQSAGINFLIFNLAIVGLLIFTRPQLIKNKIWLSVAFSAILSSFFIFIYGSALAIVANVFSLLILSAVSINSNTSFLIGIFLSVCAMGSSCVFMFIDWAKRKKTQLTEKYYRPVYVKILLLVVPFLIALVFFFLYQSSNPLFYDFTKEIDLSFISFDWIFFTIGGLLLLYGFFYNRILPGIANWDENSPLVLNSETNGQQEGIKSGMNIDTKNSSGIILLSMLNLLLLLVNTLDINYFLFNGKLPEGVDHKAFVHDGIGTLITSIIIAISIILFYFSSELNFYKKSKWLKIMAYIWIAQNVFMIFSTAYRNGMYIEESGISYKKIGVYVYLILTFIGLITTFIKVWKLKTNWYLFRVNAAVYFYLLVFSCVFNWDILITNFNIKKHNVENKKLEKYLLLDLSFKNLPELLSLPDSLASVDDFKARDYYNYSRGTYYQSFKTGLANKLYIFMKDYEQLKWQSACLEKKRVYNELMAIKSNVTEINLSGHYLQTLKPLEKFSNIQNLNFSNNRLDSIMELGMFPKLKSLNLNYNPMDSLYSFPAMNSLDTLSLSYTKITNLDMLKSLPNLASLDVSENNFTGLKVLPQLNKLVKLNLKNCGLSRLDFLTKLERLAELDLSCNTITDYSPLCELKNLKQLTISTENSQIIEQLKNCLPYTTITIVESNCPRNGAW